MKFNRNSLCPLAIFATGIFALIACQNSTEPSKSESGPITATASYTMASSSRLPDSISWKAPKDSGSRKQKCNTTTLVCSDTFHLSKPLGQDSIALQLWTLGIRTYTLYFGEKGSPTTLGLKPSFHCDLLDTLLLSKYNALTTTQKASFSALGQGASSLVAYYASLLLTGDTSFVGKSLPVGMKQDSVEKDLVCFARKEGLTISQFLAKDILPGLDSATVLQYVKLLIKAGALQSGDSAALFPPYPVRVKTPIAVNGTLTAGGSAVSISGAFVWTKGQNIKAPVIQVRTVKPGDSAYFTTPTKQFTSTDTIWNLDGNLTLQASASASAGIDTLVVTIFDDAGYSATSRIEFQVVSSAAVPTISPNGGTFYNTQNVTVAAASADSIQTSTDSVTWTKYTSAIPVTSTTKLHARAFKGGAASPVTSAAFVITTVPVPSFTPNGGSFYGADTVVVAAAGADSIQVSRDSANWTIYTAKIVVTSTGKLYARAFKGGVASTVVSAAFTSSTVPVPTIAPNGGTFYTAQTVSVTGPTGTDSLQTSTDSATWTKYTQAVSVTASGKLHARSFAGGVASPVVSASFNIATVPVPSISPNGGTFYSTQNATVVAAGADSIQTSTDSVAWTKYTTGVSVSASGKLYARAFKGGVASTVVSASFAIGTVPVPSITPNGGSFYGTTSVTVAAAESDSIQISKDSATWTKYSAALVVTSTEKLYARAFKGGVASSVTSAAFTSSAIPVPTIAPNGGTFYSTQSVSITAPTGTDSVQTSRDSVSWTKYTQEVSISSSGKLYARSFAGGVASPVVSATFTIATVPVPSISPNGGTFYSAQNATVLAAGTDSIQTSTDSVLWTKYTSVVPVTSTSKLYARAYKGGGASTVVSASYVIGTVPVPVFSLNGGVVSTRQDITVTAAGSDSIQISLDGTTNWTKYASALHVSASRTLYARAFKGGVASTVVSAAFTVPPVPVITPNGGPFTTSTSVTISIPTTTGAVIEDSLSTAPGWNTYITAFSVSSNTKVFARTRLSGATSAIAEADFAFPPTLTDTVANDTGVSAAKVTVTAPGSDSILVSTNKTSWTSVRSGGSYSMAAGTLYAISKTGSASSSVDSIVVSLFQRPPSISPNGGVFPVAKQVTITSATSGASIYYTTDGTTPASSATGSTFKYSTSITVGASKTVKAIAVKAGIVNSAIASATFAIADTNTYGIPWQTGISYEAILDTRDSQVYRTVKIGSQTWMAQNLNYRQTQGSTDTVGVCYNFDPANCATYGHSYTWTEVMAGQGSSVTSPSGVQGICPSGWHIPSDAEWSTLQAFVEPTNTTDGTKLKSTSGWANYAGGGPGSSGNGTDTYGFRALPGGSVYDGSSINSGIAGYWWSPTGYDGSTAWGLVMNYRGSYWGSNDSMQFGYSLRCAKD